MGRAVRATQEQNEIQVCNLSQAGNNSKPLVTRHHIAQKHVKGEDVLFFKDGFQDSAHDINKNNKGFSLYCLCDGHQGVEAARFVEDHFYGLLYPYMPEAQPPHNFNSAEGMKYAEQVRRALCLAFVEVDTLWSRQLKISGCTVTAVVVTGQLLTVANVGDSRAVLVCADCMLSMTVDHRVQDNKKEKQRLKVAGAHVAPISMTLSGPASSHDPGVGPLRVWPGGLCVSRSIGDIDVGPIILPTPHIKQVILPEQGSRLVLASDGLWDLISSLKVARISRTQSLESVCQLLIKQCLAIRLGFLSDDTSVLTIDFLPNPDITFPQVVKSVRVDQQYAQQSPRNRFFCFCGAVQPSVSDDDFMSENSSISSLNARNLMLMEEDTSVHYCPIKGLSPEYIRVPLKNGSSSFTEQRRYSGGSKPKPKVRVTRGSWKRVEAYKQPLPDEYQPDDDVDVKKETSQISGQASKANTFHTFATMESSNKDREKEEKQQTEQNEDKEDNDDILQEEQPQQSTNAEAETEAPAGEYDEASDPAISRTTSSQFYKERVVVMQHYVHAKSTSSSPRGSTPNPNPTPPPQQQQSNNQDAAFETTVSEQNYQYLSQQIYQKSETYVADSVSSGNQFISEAKITLEKVKVIVETSSKLPEQESMDDQEATRDEKTYQEEHVEHVQNVQDEHVQNVQNVFAIEDGSAQVQQNKEKSDYEDNNHNNDDNFVEKINLKLQKHENQADQSVQMVEHGDDNNNNNINNDNNNNNINNDDDYDDDNFGSGYDVEIKDYDDYHDQILPPSNDCDDSMVHPNGTQLQIQLLNQSPQVGNDDDDDNYGNNKSVPLSFVVPQRTMQEDVTRDIEQSTPQQQKIEDPKSVLPNLQNLSFLQPSSRLLSEKLNDSGEKLQKLSFNTNFLQPTKQFQQQQSEVTNGANNKNATQLQNFGTNFLQPVQQLQHNNNNYQQGTTKNLQTQFNFLKPSSHLHQSSNSNIDNTSNNFEENRIQTQQQLLLQQQNLLRNQQQQNYNINNAQNMEGAVHGNLLYIQSILKRDFTAHNGFFGNSIMSMESGEQYLDADDLGQIQQ